MKTALKKMIPLLGILALGSACFEKQFAIENRASYDLDCPVSAIRTTFITTDGLYNIYEAWGCGLGATYYVDRYCQTV